MLTIFFFYFLFSGLVYYTLGNLHPELRSSLKSIQLLCVVKHSYVVHYGIEKIFQPIVEAVLELEKVLLPISRFTKCLDK